MTFVRRLNSKILDFANENPALLAGTNAACTPFRGSLFGTTSAQEVDDALRSSRADILWLGSNPNTGAVEDIRAGGDARTPSGRTEFEWQRGSPWYGARLWGADGTISGDVWDPMAAGVLPWHWRVYPRILRELGDEQPECALAASKVAFANFVPWGSKDMSKFWACIRDLEAAGTVAPGLERGIWRFADALNAEVVAALRPRLIIAPVSLRDSPTGLGPGAQAEITEHPIGGSKPFTVRTAVVQRGARRVRIAYLPHPSAPGWRPNAQTMPDFKRLIADQLLLPEP